MLSEEFFFSDKCPLRDFPSNITEELRSLKRNFSISDCPRTWMKSDFDFCRPRWRNGRWQSICNCSDTTLRVWWPDCQTRGHCSKKFAILRKIETGSLAKMYGSEALWKQYSVKFTLCIFLTTTRYTHSSKRIQTNNDFNSVKDNFYFVIFTLEPSTLLVEPRGIALILWYGRKNL